MLAADALPWRLDLDRNRRGAREVAKRGRQAVVEPRRAARRPRSGGGRRSSLRPRSTAWSIAGESSSRPAGQSELQASQLDAERDESLLGAVVQVALETAALLVPGLDDAGARGLDLRELQTHLDAQPRHLDRERGGAEDPVEQVAPLPEGRVVEEHGGARVVAPDLALRALVPRQRPRDVAARIGVRLGLRQPEEELGERVADRLGHDGADLLGRAQSVSHLVLERAYEADAVRTVRAGSADRRGPGSARAAAGTPPRRRVSRVPRPTSSRRPRTRRARP